MNKLANVILGGGILFVIISVVIFILAWIFSNDIIRISEKIPSVINQCFGSLQGVMSWLLAAYGLLFLGSLLVVIYTFVRQSPR